MHLNRLGPVLVLLALACACRSSPSSDPDAAPDIDSGSDYPPARTDLVPSVGSSSTLDIATWNLENFPRFSTTPQDTADLIASLDLDLVAVQEIHSIAAFDELVARLPGYSGILSAHTYGDGTFQKIGYVYRESVVAVTAPALLFQNNGWEFPRPPLKVRVEVVGTDLDFDAISLHLKAGGGAENEERRQDALALLEGNVRASVDGSGDDDVLVLGDFNDVLAGGQIVFGPWLEETDRYQIETQTLEDLGDYSYVPSKRLIDHIVSSAALEDELVGSKLVIPDLVDQFDGYVTMVSDHLPVVISLPMP